MERLDVTTLARALANIQRDALRQIGKDAQVRFRQTWRASKHNVTGQMAQSITPRVYLDRVRVGSPEPRARIHNNTKGAATARIEQHERTTRGGTVTVAAHERKRIQFEFISATIAEQDLGKWEANLMSQMEQLFGVSLR